MNRRILIIEDELGMLLALRDRLTSEGYVVQTARDGASGFEYATRETFDLILLDIMLPGKGGFDICRDLRQLKISTPIIMLTARGETYDKVLGLKIGADDYLTKPFETAELLARVEVQLRRTAVSVAASTDSDYYVFGAVRVDFRRAEVFRGQEKIELSAREYKLLEHLIRERGKVLSRNEILDAVWGSDVNVTTRTVDVHIAWLRQKLEENPRHPRYLLTAHGLGYRFEN
jgi:two-component system, OmpR family, alkaline phosphatase synthesis response regulator PhoP